jgi:hypothetical protein
MLSGRDPSDEDRKTTWFPVCVKVPVSVSVVV